MHGDYLIDDIAKRMERRTFMGGTFSNVSQTEPPKMTLEALQKAMQLIKEEEASPPPKIIRSRYWPSKPSATETYTVRFDAHPFIKLLARFLPIAPYIEATYPTDTSSPILDKIRNCLYCSYAHYEQMKQLFPPLAPATDGKDL